MFLPAWRNNSGSFLWCVDMEKPHFSRSKSVFLTQSTRYYSELNFAKPEEKVFHHITLRNQLQGVCVAVGSLRISEKMEYPRRKVAQIFHLTE